MHHCCPKKRIYLKRWTVVFSFPLVFFILNIHSHNHLRNGLHCAQQSSTGSEKWENVLCSDKQSVNPCSRYWSSLVIALHSIVIDYQLRRHHFYAFYLILKVKFIGSVLALKMWIWVLPVLLNNFQCQCNWHCVPVVTGVSLSVVKPSTEERFGLR